MNRQHFEELLLVLEDDEEEVLAINKAMSLLQTPSSQRNVVHKYRWRGPNLTRYMLESDTLCIEMVRMNCKTFLQLVVEMRRKELLKDSHFVKVEEQLRIFLEILGHKEGIRLNANYFSHSSQKIHKYFEKVLQALCKWSVEMIKPRVSLHITPAHIRSKTKYYLWLKDCIRAIDGTHIFAHVKKDKQQAFRGKCGQVTQNIMAACDFNMRFTFIPARWEGTAHDSCIFSHAITKPDARFPFALLGKYYVVDAGYPNSPGFLAPYKKTHYHVPEFQRRGPRGRNENFNHLHSSLRNIIERTFGVWKQRWHMFDRMPQYAFHKQTKMVLASMALHNFIKEQQDLTNDSDLRDALFGIWENDDYIGEPGPILPPQAVPQQQDSINMGLTRDGIRDEIGNFFKIPPIQNAI